MIEFKKKEFKNDNCTFRCFDFEKELIKEIADHYGISISEYCYTVIMHDFQARLKDFKEKQK